MLESIRVIDVETTGLDPVKNEIIDISILGLDGRSHFTSKVKPVQIETASEEALRINGYLEAKWRHAPTFEEVADQIHDALHGRTILGHNVAFDRRFVEEAFRKLRMPPPKMPHRVLDTSTLIYEHLMPVTGWDTFSLERVAKFLGVHEGIAHTAYSDAQMTRKVALKLMRATFLHRLWWRVKARV